MTFDFPRELHLPQLLKLWKEAFGEHSGFWELFLETAFSPMRCRCILEDNQVRAALTWLDCEYDGQPLAYIYAVVTDPAHRGRGLCRKLLEDTHVLLKCRGYAAALLVPEGDSLWQMYRRFGYREGTSLREFSCDAGDAPLPLRAIGPTEYAALRRSRLPRGGVVQEGESLAFLSRQAEFFAGEDVLLAAYREDGILTALELLGNAEHAPAIVHALDCRQGRFRTPGTEHPFALLYPLTPDFRAPDYFGFAFD